MHLVFLGEHPRIGAMDVCPFIPVSGVSMEECVGLSRELGQQLAWEFGVPVYLYEESQEREYRKSLSKIRVGNYEGLKQKVWSTYYEAFPHVHMLHMTHSCTHIHTLCTYV